MWTRCDSYYRSPSGRIVTQWPHSEIDYARATWRLRPRDLGFTTQYRHGDVLCWTTG